MNIIYITFIFIPFKHLNVEQYSVLIPLVGCTHNTSPATWIIKCFWGSIYPFECHSKAPLIVNFITLKRTTIITAKCNRRKRRKFCAHLLFFSYKILTVWMENAFQYLFKLKQEWLTALHKSDIAIYVLIWVG